MKCNPHEWRETVKFISHHCVRVMSDGGVGCVWGGVWRRVPFRRTRGTQTDRSEKAVKCIRVRRSRRSCCQERAGNKTHSFILREGEDPAAGGDGRASSRQAEARSRAVKKKKKKSFHLLPGVIRQSASMCCPEWRVE